jgi:hypothetical protein
LDVPTERDLRSRLSVGGSNVDENRIGKKCSPDERRVRLGRDPVFGIERAERVLGEARVYLYLVHGWDHVGLVEEPLEVMGVEVRNPDRSRPTFFVDSLERAPDLDNVTP